MKKEYELKTRILLNLSPTQQRDLPALYAVLLAMKYKNLRGDELDKINPEWLEQEIKRFKDFDISYKLRFLKEGMTTNHGLFDIKKTKEGFVLKVSTTWRIKGTKKDYYACGVCGKKVPLNEKYRCKKCKGKRLKL